MSALSVVWEKEALELLQDRDQFTQKAIREEFRRDPEKGAIEFDPDHSTFVTSVSDRRFSVVWRWNEPDQQAVVRAVVPLTNFPRNANELAKPEALDEFREYVRRAVSVESKGRIQI